MAFIQSPEFKRGFRTLLFMSYSRFLQHGHEPCASIVAATEERLHSVGDVDGVLETFSVWSAEDAARLATPAAAIKDGWAMKAKAFRTLVASGCPGKSVTEVFNALKQKAPHFQRVNHRKGDAIYVVGVRPADPFAPGYRA